MHSSLHRVKWKSTHGYGEAKSASQSNNSYLVCQDLLRIAIFCKNAFDVHNMEGVLGQQVIGRTITFYVSCDRQGCIQSFSHVHALRQHQRADHDPLHCNQCERVFISEGLLARHQAADHILIRQYSNAVRSVSLAHKYL